MRVALGAILGLFLAVMFLVSGCEPESGPPAAKTDDGKDLRGMILNDDKSKASIRIYSNWRGGDDPGNAKPTKLGVGSQANLSKDWDGFCLPKGHSANVKVTWGPIKFERELTKGQCQKISDGQTAIVRVR